jgi:chemotaxis protein CheZ
MSTHHEIGAAMMKSLVRTREQKGAICIEDLGDILAEVAASIQVSNQPEQFLRGEFRKISERIDQAKLEIASIVQQEGMTSPQHIGHATDQLDAVIKATEEATNSIMDAADKIQQAVDDNAPDMREVVSNEVAQIFMACNFQDITGQRITKVLTTLEYIDTKVHSILSLFGEVSEEDILKAAENNPSTDARPDAHLLEGPQLNATSQDDIDALFASIGKG